jgi:hypothetical protein
MYVRVEFIQKVLELLIIWTRKLNFDTTMWKLTLEYGTTQINKINAKDPCVCILVQPLNITFFKCGPADPSQQCKTASNSIQDPLPHWSLTIFKLKFGGRNLFSLAMTSTIEGNNSVGSLLKPLLKKVTP